MIFTSLSRREKKRSRSHFPRSDLAEFAIRVRTYSRLFSRGYVNAKSRLICARTSRKPHLFRILIVLLAVRCTPIFQRERILRILFSFALHNTSLKLGFVYFQFFFLLEICPTTSASTSQFFVKCIFSGFRALTFAFVRRRSRLRY